ncbi:WAS/WASL-interacting protein family member 1-like isoform X2 [Eriocheir sinensis]|uniref:WAS/WASL-interacting protein family member 1-like isoform X2 n=1 Tax=Eriocheir sinensis TaxID=95602 RepID=UPI0021C9BA2C|nr:WAS/WASL-interacting protein family member 1-like isoform X2 [Eriocheir sinensis]
MDYPNGRISGHHGHPPSHHMPAPAPVPAHAHAPAHAHHHHHHYSSHLPDLLRFHQPPPPMLYRTVEKMWGGGGPGGGGGGGGGGGLPAVGGPPIVGEGHTPSAHTQEGQDVKMTSASPPPTSVATSLPSISASSTPPAPPTPMDTSHLPAMLSQLSQGLSAAAASMQRDSPPPTTNHHTPTSSAHLPAPPSPTPLDSSSSSQDVMKMETSESEAAAGGSDTPHNGPSMPPGLGPAVAAAAAAAAAGGVGAHTFLQQTMSQLLRPSSARPDLVPSPPSHLGHGSETPRPPYWGAPHDLRPDADRQDTHSPPTSDPTKMALEKVDSISGSSSGFPTKSPPPLNQFNVPAELFQVSYGKNLCSISLLGSLFSLSYLLRRLPGGLAARWWRDALAERRHGGKLWVLSPWPS